MLQELDKAEQLQSDARIKLALYKYGRPPKLRKREITSAKLRSVAPEYDADRMVPLRYLFKLYSLSYTEPRVQVEEFVDPKGSSFSLPTLGPVASQS